MVNAHDHLIRVGAGEVYIDPDHQLADVDKVVEEATRFVTASKNWAAAGTVVDMCPANCGRDLNKLAEVNRRVPDLHAPSPPKTRKPSNNSSAACLRKHAIPAL